MFTILLFCVIVTLTKTDDMNKRLLLNDPDVVASRLRNLELTIQSLQSTVAKLESKNAEYEAKMSAIHGLYHITILSDIKI
jgi:hypothetical protein